jgi:hypothetical protein
VIKAKKRRLGRVQKTIGDYCLLAGSPVDANAHYSTALELARLTTDYFWYAGALEGSFCALLVCASFELNDKMTFMSNASFCWSMNMVMLPICLMSLACHAVMQLLIFPFFLLSDRPDKPNQSSFRG